MCEALSSFALCIAQSLLLVPPRVKWDDPLLAGLLFLLLSLLEDRDDLGVSEQLEDDEHER